jgi:hypothetical protein
MEDLRGFGKKIDKKIKHNIMVNIHPEPIVFRMKRSAIRNQPLAFNKTSYPQGFGLIPTAES